MTKMQNLNSNKLQLFVLIFILLTNIALFLNIPYLRQILGFLLLTFLPGLLLIRILKVDKIGFTEMLVLSVGLSISFIMFFGLLVNNISLTLDYNTPLLTAPLLVSINAALILFLIITNVSDKNTNIYLPVNKLTTEEKALLIPPVSFPLMSIFGMNLMNIADNNTILVFLLISISLYFAGICILKPNYSKEFYQCAIFLISISLVLLMSLRSNHIIGIDTHMEYYAFQSVMKNMHWDNFVHSGVDSCLAISLLPTIYQSTLNVPPEILYKILCPLLFSITPLAIFINVNKYINNAFSFMASFFFISQRFFLQAELFARSSFAILFVSLAIMTLYNDKISLYAKKTIFIIFMASSIVSHYSTSYIFIIFLLCIVIGRLIFKNNINENTINIRTILIFFSMIFTWYSLFTGPAFNSGIRFIKYTIINLGELFVDDMRSYSVNSIMGEGIIQKGLPHKIEFILTWLIFVIIAIGVFTLFLKSKYMSFSALNYTKSAFLRDKLEVDYFMSSFYCIIMLVAIVVIPFMSREYSLDRMYSFTCIILSLFFLIGVIAIAGYLSDVGSFLQYKRSKNKYSYLQVSLILLSVTIPYFLCTTGVMYQIFDVPKDITLNSEGVQYNLYYIHDQDSNAAKWVEEYTGKLQKVSADFMGADILTSQGMVSPDRISKTAFAANMDKDELTYLRYYNIAENEIYLIIEGQVKTYKVSEIITVASNNDLIFNNGGSKIWK